MTAATEKEARPEQDKRWRMVDVTMRRHGYKANALIETLHAVQEAFGYLDEENLIKVAHALKLPPSKVYGVATFYHFFRMKPKGRHTCVVCLGTACYIKGAEDILNRVGKEYGVDPGGTTPDGHLSLLTARCVGSCGLAPALVIDDSVLGHLDAEAVVEHLKGLPHDA
ncbi:MAG TPA: bidirectional hydrogenase complex protein HoxE [Kiritimatiellia bacterium]|nr:bidirectional hydrogenase complex protein HoxE [Kiritimatiellia bacterium]